MKNIFSQNGQCRLDHFYNNAIDNAGIHKHNFYELFFFVSGTAYYIIRGERVKISPGHILLIDRNTLHTPIVNPDTPKVYTRYVLSIEPDFMDSLCTECTDLRQCFSVKDEHVLLLEPDPPTHKTIMGYLKSLAEVASIQAYGYDVIRSLYIAQLLLQLNSISMNITFHLEKDFLPHSMLIDSISDYICQNFHHDLRLEEIAANFFISKSHLCHHFKEKTGITVNEYIQMQRINYAKFLLGKGQRITEIAQQCGYTDPSAFYRAFKKIEGMSPVQYRQKEQVSVSRHLETGK